MADIIGTPNNDTLIGSGPILIDGGAGQDVLITTGGASTLQGGAGSDNLYTGGAGAVLQGGDGNDYLTVAPGMTVGPAYQLLVTLSQEGGGVTLQGGAGDDVYEVRLTSSSVDVTIDPFADADSPTVESEVLRMPGGRPYAPGAYTFWRDGNDLLVVDEQWGNTVRVVGNFYQLMAGGKTYSAIDLIEVGGARLSGDEVQALVQPLPQNPFIGTEGNDTLVGTSRADKLSGLAGDDLLRGGLGSDTLSGGLGADTMEGGLGNDVYHVDNVGDVVTEISNAAEPYAGGRDTVRTNLNDYTLPTGVEALAMGGKQNMEPDRGDWFTAKAGLRHGVGNDLNNLMTSGGGDVFFEGGKGADTLVGGDGNDTLAGTFYTGQSSDANLVDSVVDTLIGGRGDDTYVLLTPSGTGSSQLDQMVEKAGEGTDTVITNLLRYALQVGSNIENVTSDGERVTGNELNNVLKGKRAYAELFGGAGDDTLLGSGYLNGAAGNDLMKSDGLQSDDRYVWSLDGGHDVIEDAGGVADVLQVLGGQQGVADIRFERQGNDLVLSSLDGAHSCTVRGWYEPGGSAQIDYIQRGSDEFLSAAAVDDMVALWAQVPTVTHASGSNEVPPAIGMAMQALWQTGLGEIGSAPRKVLATNGNILGSSGDDTLGAANVVDYGRLLLSADLGMLLYGGAGQDRLTGALGDDTLIGGVGADTMRGGHGMDTYRVDDIGDVVIDLWEGEGTRNTLWIDRADYSLTSGDFDGDVYFSGADTLSHRFIGGFGNETVHGRGGNDFLTGGSGDDQLIGGAGDDTLVASDEPAPSWTLTSTGMDYGFADELMGGAGHDRYVLANGLNASVARVVEAAGEGMDTVRAGSLFYRMTDHVEVLEFLGQSAMGNAQDNLMQGMADSFQDLSGLGGDDTLVAGWRGARMSGGLGNDVMMSATVAAGDEYVWGLGLGRDLITDAGGADTLRLSGVTDVTTLTWQRRDQDLVISPGTSDQCVIQGWFDSSADHQIERVVLDDGRSVRAADINAAMAASAGAPTAVNMALWQVRPDNGSVQDAWGDVAVNLLFDGGWSNYLNQAEAKDALPWRLRGSSVADEMRLSGQTDLNVKTGQGDDAVNILQWGGVGKVLTIDAGDGNDSISLGDAAYSANFNSGEPRASVDVTVVLGQGQDTLNLSRRYEMVAGDSTVTLQVAPGSQLSDYVIETDLAAGFHNQPSSVVLLNQRTGDRLTLDGVRADFIGTDGQFSEDQHITLSDGNNSVSLGALLTQEFQPQIASLQVGQAAGSSGQNANDVYRLGRSPEWANAQPIEIRDAGGQDTLVFDVTVDSSFGSEGLFFQRQNNDLQITVYSPDLNTSLYGTQGPSVVVKDWYLSADHQLESIQFTGHDWLGNTTRMSLANTQVQSLVDAMAAYAVPTQAGQGPEQFELLNRSTSSLAWGG